MTATVALADETDQSRPDLRLLLPALAAWMGTLVGTLLSPRGAALAAAAMVIVAVLFGLPGGRRLVACAALMCLLAGVGAGVARVVALDRGPVAALAHARAHVSVRATLTEDPVLRSSTTPPARSYVIARARVEEISGRGEVASVRAPVLVIARRELLRSVPGQQLRISGRLAPADSSEGLAGVLRTTGDLVVVGQPSWIQRWTEPLRRGLRESVDHLPDGPRGLVPALVVGDRSKLPPEVTEDMRVAGLLHLNAVSGANVRLSSDTLSGVTLRAVIYARVSQDPAAKRRNGDRNGAQHGRSVDEQLKECRAVIEREGWRLVRTFKDNDRSASRYASKAREEYEALVRYLQEGRADVLVCWEASRAQRDLQAYVKLRDLCAANGVRWSYSGRTYDLERSDDRFTTGLDALLAERESDVTRDRVRRAVRANAVSGKPHGKLLYGYRREYDATSGKLIAQEPDEIQAPILREAARRVLAGESLYAITVDFGARGIPPPRAERWWPETLRRLLVNPGYAAKRVHQGRIIGEAQWPALLAEEDWQRLCRKLKDPARSTHRDTSVKHLLSGIARCGKGDCDNPVRVQKNRGFLAYLSVPCFHVSRKQENVDHLVSEVIIARLSRPDAADLFALPNHDGTAEARQQAAALRERLDQFYDSAAAGEITAAALGRIEARLLAEIAEADSRAVRAGMPVVLRDIAGRSDMRARWNALSMPQRREVIRVLIDVRILPAKRGRDPFDPQTVSIEWKSP